MHVIHAIIEGHLPVAWVALGLAFALLAKSADVFVDSSVSLANRFRIPKLVIGIVLVSLATTAPELSVSLIAALKGNPEMALGNAIGSVICNTGLALALCAVIAGAAVPVIPHVLNTSGGFLLFVGGLCFLFVGLDAALSRWEGAVLAALFAAYLYFLFRQHRKGTYHDDIDMEAATVELGVSPARMFTLFAVSLAGIVLASDLIVTSATTIARWAKVPEAIIALTLVALGTSIPEVATSVTAARKGEGALAVGNILGANIMDICCVAGLSAMANTLAVSRKEALFMFCAMFVVLPAALIMLRAGYRLTKRQGVVLLGLYLAYLASFFFLFPPAT